MTTHWRMARSLDVALNEVNRSAPHRDKASDGGIGDADHASRDSDHNPWVKDHDGQGVVRARDFDHDPAGGFDAGIFATHVAGLLGRHPALGSGAYVIYNRRIISTSRLSEGWRYYDGLNAHLKHVHVSVGLTGYDNTTPWGWPPHNEEDDMNTEQDKRLTRVETKIDGLAKALDSYRRNELLRDKNSKARDKRVLELLKGTNADAAAVLAALEDDQ